MLSTRIKKRPYSFTAWVLTILLLVAILFSFYKYIIITRLNSQCRFVRGVVSISPLLTPKSEETGFEISIKNAPPTPNMFPPPNMLEQMKLMFALPQHTSYLNASISYCPMGIPALILITISSWHFWRRLSYPPSHCQSCGYNLKGNKSGKCPECGQVVN